MNNLFFYELKKMLSSKLLIFAVLFLLFINGFNIYTVNDKFHDKANLDVTLAEWQIYLLFEGKITEKKTEALQNYKNDLELAAQGNAELERYYLNAYSDLTLVSRFLGDLKNAEGYKEQINSLLNENEKQSSVYEKKDNGYLIKTAQLIGERYANREITEFYNVEPFDNYFGYDFSSVLILMLVFLASSKLFAGERESGMEILLKSTLKGKRELNNAKINVLVSFTVIICILFFLTDFFMFEKCLRFRGLDNPLYSIKNYIYTPLNISIGSFTILHILLKLIGITAFASLGALFSSLFDKSLIVFVCDVFALAFFMLLSVYTNEALDVFNLFNPITMLLSRQMFFDFNAVNIFGFPVLKCYVAFACNSLFILLTTAVTAKINSGKKRVRA